MKREVLGFSPTNHSLNEITQLAKAINDLRDLKKKNKGIHELLELFSHDDFLSHGVEVVKMIENPSDEIVEYVVKEKPDLILNIKNPSDKAVRLAVTQKPELIEFLPQTEELCLIAVNRNPLTLRFVKEQTEEICLVALNSVLGVWGKDVFKYIQVRTQRVCEAAVRTNPTTIKEMKDQSEAFYNSMIKANWRVIEYIENATSEQCLLAYEQDERALDYFKL